MLFRVTISQLLCATSDFYLTFLHLFQPYYMQCLHHSWEIAVLPCCAPWWTEWSTWDQDEQHVLQYYCSRCKDQKGTGLWGSGEEVNMSAFYEHGSITALSILLYMLLSGITSEPSTTPDTHLNILDGLFPSMLQIGIYALKLATLMNEFELCFSISMLCLI